MICHLSADCLPIVCNLATDDSISWKLWRTSWSPWCLQDDFTLESMATMMYTTVHHLYVTVHHLSISCLQVVTKENVHPGNHGVQSCTPMYTTARHLSTKCFQNDQVKSMAKYQFLPIRHIGCIIF